MLCGPPRRYRLGSMTLSCPQVRYFVGQGGQCEYEVIRRTVGTRHAHHAEAAGQST
jgi:hypothetical protein